MKKDLGSGNLPLLIVVTTGFFPGSTISTVMFVSFIDIYPINKKIQVIAHGYSCSGL